MVARPRMCPRYCYGTHSSTYILKVYHAEGKTTLADIIYLCMYHAC